MILKVNAYMDGFEKKKTMSTQDHQMFGRNHAEFQGLEWCKGVQNCLDLYNCSKTTVHSQKPVSIQPKTSLPKFPKIDTS